MTRHRVARIEGDLTPLMANLRYVKEVLERPRRVLARAPVAAESVGVPSSGAIEPIVGRYVRLTIEGVPHRIAFEEARRGTPLVCVHTAGSDSRQFRHLMNDAAITRDWRVIAFDHQRPGAGQRDRLVVRHAGRRGSARCRVVGLERLGALAQDVAVSGVPEASRLAVCSAQGVVPLRRASALTIPRYATLT